MNVVDFFRLLRAPARNNLTALETAAGPVSYGMLEERIGSHAERLAACGEMMVASLMDNGENWIIHDLACLQLGIVHFPLPLFFTADQLRGTLRAGGVGLVAADPASSAMLAELGFERVAPNQGGIALFSRPAPQGAAAPHPGSAKITFTSGSTGHPKGVCLGADAMLAVAESLARATGPLGVQRHMTVLPLPILLENIAGVYAPLLDCAAIVVRPLNEVGIQGSSGFDPAIFHSALETTGAQSVIVLPQMLRGYAAWLGAAGLKAPSALRLAAVGGAAVGAPLLAGARALGIPAYEGYGLSEACSVQTLNLPGADCPGSAGRPLPHASLRIADDGEIEVSGSLSVGYLGQPARSGDWLPTGDLGHMDEAGFLHIDGRKKNVLITGFGRNVSPEWIELQLTGQPEIAQAVVLGDGQPALGAVVWPLGDTADVALAACVDRVNRTLPDYARIGRWTRARAAFSPASGLATPNGRPRRDAVATLHADLFT